MKQKHYGFLCPPVAGHLNPMLALGVAVQRLGHRVTFISVPDAEAKIIQEGLGYQPMGNEPIGTVKASLARLAELSELEALAYTSELTRQALDMLCTELPKVLGRMSVDGLFVDQVGIGCESVAEALGLPFVSVANSLAQNGEVRVPPWISPWDYDDSALGLARNQLGYLAGWMLGQPILWQLNSYRQKWGLVPKFSFDDLLSPLAQLSQLVQGFDFPRSELPGHFHYCGPFRPDPSSSREVIQFPYERLDDRPLVYASLGTIQNGRPEVFETIAQACSGLGVQLVMSLGGGSLAPESLGELPGEPLVVRYAPQLELLERASLVITHAGLNTTLEALSQGVPLVAIPVTNDQPGVAARIRHSGVGRTIPLSELGQERIRQDVALVLREPVYKQAALRLRSAILKNGGAAKAAEVGLNALYSKRIMSGVRSYVPAFSAHFS